MFYKNINKTIKSQLVKKFTANSEQPLAAPPILPYIYIREREREKQRWRKRLITR